MKCSTIVTLCGLAMSWSQLVVASSGLNTLNYQDLGVHLATPYEWDDADREEQRKKLEDLNNSLRPKGLEDLFNFKVAKAKIGEVKQDKSRQIRNMALMLNTQARYHQNSDSLTIDSVDTAIRDLELFVNLDGTYKNTLFKAIDRTKTVCGQLVLASMLANPLGNIDELKKRREFLSYLLEHPRVVSILNKIISNASGHESKALELFGMDPAFRTVIHNHLGDPGFKSGFFRNFHDVSTGFFAISGITAYLELFSGKFLDLDPYTRSIMTPSLILSPLFVPTSIKKIRETHNLHRLIHSYTISVADIFRDLEITSTLISQNENLKALKHHDLTRKLREDLHEFGDKFQTVYRSIKKNDSRYKGEGRYWTVSAAAVLRVYTLLPETQDDFGQVFEALGEIDAYLSIVSLIKEFEGKPTSFVLANFLENSEPTLDMKSLWTPLLDPGKAVTNDLSMDENRSGIVLTGSNTAGKSTLLRSILGNLLMAQGLGVAAAESFNFTPFKQIISGMNVLDNISKGVSLFQSEVNRAKSLLQGLDKLGEDQFGFVILDELFTGTASDRGKSAAEKVAKKLFSNSAAKTVFATHYKEITKLGETESSVENLKLDVTKKADGSYIRSFKLESGISEQNIADDILNKDLEEFDINF